MSDANPKIDQVRTSSNFRTLSKIAVALGVPEDALFSSSEDKGSLRDLSELLRIWDGLKHGKARQELLAHARALAERD